MINGPEPTGSPATCELMPEGCRNCSMDCQAAGEWNDDVDQYPDVRLDYQDDWTRWWENRT